MTHITAKRKIAFLFFSSIILSISLLFLEIFEDTSVSDKVWFYRFSGFKPIIGKSAPSKYKANVAPVTEMIHDMMTHNLPQDKTFILVSETQSPFPNESWSFIRVVVFKKSNDGYRVLSISRYPPGDYEQKCFSKGGEKILGDMVPYAKYLMLAEIDPVFISCVPRAYTQPIFLRYMQYFQDTQKTFLSKQ